MQQRPLQLAVITEFPYRSEMLEYLAAGKGWKLVTTSGQPDPVATLRGQAVDLVLIDLELPQAMTLFKELTQRLPNMPLLALATATHLTEFQEARLAGALDFVAFPINHQHFFLTIERVLTRPLAAAPASPVRGQMVALVSLKGGVGRSTLAANLAVALRQRQSKEVILAEAHHGLGQLGLMLNLRPRYTVANLVTESMIDADLVRGYLQAHPSGIRLLAAPSEPSQLLELTEDGWQRVLSLLTELASSVVVDTAATTDAALSQVLTRADEILLLVEPTIASLYSARALLETLRTEKEIQARLYVVYNQADRSGGLSETVIEKHLGEKICLSVPSDPALATFSMNRGVPFVTSHPRAQISRRVLQLADQLLKNSILQEKTTPQHRMSPFSSLLSMRRG